MSAPSTDTGRRGTSPAAGAALSWLRDPLNRLIGAVCLLGAVLATAVVLWFPEPHGVLRSHHIDGWWLLPALIVLTGVAEMTVVKLRHGEAEEELSLYEAAIIIDVLLLPASHALAAAALGLVIASALRRRPLLKSVFNLGTYTAAVSVLVAVVHVVAGSPGSVTWRVVAGVLLGTSFFTVVNLGCLAQVLARVNGVPAWQIFRSEVRLSAYMAIGTVATGLTTAVIGLNAPVLLPFMAMPALAVTYAYRAAAQEADERARSACLLRLSQALAERDDVVRQFLLLVREAFDADVAVVVLHDAQVALTVDERNPKDVTTGPPPQHLASLRGIERAELLSEDLPPQLRRLLVVPMEAGDRRFGIVALAIRQGRRARLSTRDLTVLAPLVNALAAAMRGAEHLDRLVAETSKLQAIAEQSTEGIFMVDGDGAVQMWSRAFAELTEISAERAAGRPLAELLDVPDPVERAALLPVTADRPKAAVEVTIRRPDGEPRRLRLAHSAIFSEDILVRDVVVVRDLTREHRTDRLKSDFIATVSHELRTPLTPIIGYLDLLKTRGERMTPQKRTECLTLMADRAAHLSRLVEDLLMASRVDDADEDLALHVSVGAHDLTAIVRQVVDDLDSPRVTVALPDHAVPTRCDAERTLQVVSNLVGNALKYSPETEPVRVAMRLDGERVHVEVADHGRGIPADQLQKVFEKFHRVEDPMTMSTSGTGLGLFIARRLAQAMGGEITVDSTLNVGSVFTLTLRCGDAPAMNAESELSVVKR
ncbi:PAS domain S-box-containing protein [Micromonospora pattaloongensis]|uniref:histidine kinase n=1 Tax=Micromonospora pattaloongensis TaxID=405436 RepID=A0A1H3QV64_9ACTN|nr:ATP-binding protein [Micromonospora pattaloongensis]SDZ17133.1 PAS domain S-box-containing protein [Micromonospora pattaloongensis]